MSSLPVSSRFFKVMVPGFRTKLSLPKVYCTKLKGQLPEEAFLTNSKGTWRVEIGQCSQGKLCFLGGWASFVEAHDLKIGEFVIFEQTGFNQFEVLVFDSTNCDKEFSVEVHLEEEEEEEKSSYAASADKHVEFTRRNCSSGRKRGRQQNIYASVKQEVFPSEVHKTEADSESDLEEYATKGIKRGRGRGRGRPRTRTRTGKRPLSPVHREPSLEIFEEKPELGENLFSSTIKKRGRGRPRKTHQSLHQERNHQHNKNHDEKGFPKKTNAVEKLSGKYFQRVRMSRIFSNETTSDGKTNQFLQKITSYNIQRCFIVYIPAVICRSYCISEETVISLKGPYKECHEMKVKKHCLGRLCIATGWREFCASNNIELGDICVFTVIKTVKNEVREISDFVLMDVKVTKA